MDIHIPIEILNGMFWGALTGVVAPTIVVTCLLSIFWISYILPQRKYVEFVYYASGFLLEGFMNWSLPEKMRFILYFTIPACLIGTLVGGSIGILFWYF